VLTFALLFKPSSCTRVCLISYIDHQSFTVALYDSLRDMPPRKRKASKKTVAATKSADPVVEAETHGDRDKQCGDEAKQVQHDIL
jgi:hypothetical protein